MSATLECRKCGADCSLKHMCDFCGAVICDGCTSAFPTLADAKGQDHEQGDHFLDFDEGDEDADEY